jgi:hypothetical protein
MEKQGAHRSESGEENIALRYLVVSLQKHYIDTI